MINKLMPFFIQYEGLSKTADHVFDQIRQEHSDCVTCKTECTDCCHALFDLTLIEALYLNYHFNKSFSGTEKDLLLEIANRADRRVHQIKREAHRALLSGATETDVLLRVAGERICCPLLDNHNLCRLYAFRPITCRLYGVPTSIRGTGHTCGRSGFAPGDTYPTVNLDIIQGKLFEISSALIKEIRSRHFKMSDMLFPVSMALLIDFDEDYLGISSTDPAETEKTS